MKKFKDLLNSKNANKSNLLIAISIGVILIIVGSNIARKQATPEESQEQPKEQSISTNEYVAYEEHLEKELEAILSLVEGVGEVDVMITLSSSEEIVYAQDSNMNNSTTTETDSQGGERTSADEQEDSTYVMYESENGTQPLVVEQKAPEIEGVLIIAEGGDDPDVQYSLTKTCEAVLGVPANKVQVLKMESE